MTTAVPHDRRVSRARLGSTGKKKGGQQGATEAGSMARCDFPRQQAQHWGEVTGGGECGPGLRGHDCQPLLLCPPELGAGDTGTEAWLFFFFFGIEIQFT